MSGEKRKWIDVESQYMAKALISVGLMYGVKKDAKLEACVQLNLKFIEMNILAKERAVQE